MQNGRNGLEGSAAIVACALMGLAITLFAALPAHAAVTGGSVTGGDIFGSGVVDVSAAPPVLGNDQFDDDDVHAFDEVQDLTLSANLILDIAGPGVASNVLGSGATVSSHYVIFDPATTKTAIGSVTFSQPVLGIIRTNLRFNDTDALLGAPGTTYSIGSQQLDAADSVTISGNQIDFSLSSRSPGDAIRVVTGINPVFGINLCESASQTLSGTITGGDALANGGAFKQICDPIGDVGNDNYDSYDLFAFEEQQAVELDADLYLDETTIVASGEIVSSFYVVWDPVPTHDVIATVTFPDTIVGVIATKDELIASDFLGNASANYLSPNERGLELGGVNADSYSVAGNQLSIDFNAGSPGDSIRVILGSASPSLSYNPCGPGEGVLTGLVTGGTAATAGGVFSELCVPIGPIGNNNLQSNDLFAFEERENIVLAAPLVVDLPTATSLPAGTLISSYYVAFDPSNGKDVTGEITFPGTILGVMTSKELLTDSDHLGAPSGNYLNPGLRGLESGVDSASFAASTLTVTLAADSPGDYIRVIVAGNQVAVPAVGPLGAGLLFASLFGCGAFLSRRHGRTM